MDRRAVVETPRQAPKTITIEQAVFTSIRSPMGQGYRIVAASPGITSDEKRQIVQYAPSHDSLCDSSPAAEALASFPLESGRHCIFLSRTAGAEYTARGGYRIHTHVLVLDPTARRTFYGNPLAVRDAAQGALDIDVKRAPPSRLQPIVLSFPGVAPAAEHGLPVRPLSDDATALRVLHVLDALLSDRPLLVCGTDEPERALTLLLSGLPASLRAQFSFSYGLKFAPARRFQVVFAEHSRKESERLLGGQDVDLYVWEDEPALRLSAHRVWLNFVRQRWLADRAAEVELIARQIVEERSAEALANIATLCDDIEHVRRTDEEWLEQALAAHENAEPTSAFHAKLLDSFRHAAYARQEELEAEKQAEEENEDADADE